jgi:hypothetical protein
LPPEAIASAGTSLIDQAVYDQHMQLKPCAACQRHVAITEVACPFCSEPLEASSPRSSTLGRVSRAAVFAGAALATTACGKKAKQPDMKTNTQQTQPADAAVVEDPKPDPNNTPMPYGAPPARRRFV